MADFNTYKDSFPHAKLFRTPEGVLEVVLHTNGGSVIFNGYTHEEYVDLFHQINQNYANRVVILTGAGEAFIDRIEGDGFDFFTPRGYDKIYREGKKVLANILDIPVRSSLRSTGRRRCIRNMHCFATLSLRPPILYSRTSRTSPLA
jgi:hypothetical protein